VETTASAVGPDEARQQPVVTATLDSR